MPESCDVPRPHATPEEIRQILQRARTVAVVGLSDKPARDSYRVAAYLQSHGYRILPVNPSLTKVLGERAYPDLSSLPSAPDVVDIFRKPEAVPEIVEQAIAVGATVIWMQEGIVHNAAAERARGRLAGGDEPVYAEGPSGVDRIWSLTREWNYADTQESACAYRHPARDLPFGGARGEPGVGQWELLRLGKRLLSDEEGAGRHLDDDDDAGPRPL